MIGREPLRVVVPAGCAACRTARDLIEAVRRLRLVRSVEVIDPDDRDATVPAGVVGTPTFLIGKEILSMGDPCLALLLDTLDGVESADR